jgi:hypothetical protein
MRMGLLNFLKAKLGASASLMSGDLTFESSQGAADYVRDYMRTEWTQNSLVTGLICNPVFRNGVLRADLLIPKGDELVALESFSVLNPSYSAVSADKGGNA